jgi:hypothetical protein
MKGSGSMLLAKRGVSAVQFQADLKACVRAWGTEGKLAAAMETTAGSVRTMAAGYDRPPAFVVKWLYGPGQGGALVARGPYGKAVERRWVEAPRPAEPEPAPAPAPEPEPETEQRPASPHAGGGVQAGAPCPPCGAPADPSEPAPWAGLPDVTPWSGLPDGDLLKILRGKLAGVQAEIAALEARENLLRNELAGLNGHGVELEVRVNALLAAIAAFEEAAA